MPTDRSTSASATLVALCFTAVLGIALASYLALQQRAYDLATRAYHVATARQLAQTGIEEELWALNQGNWASAGPTGGASWSTSGANYTATLDYGAVSPGATGTLVLTVANYASTGPTWPTLTSAATVTLGDGRTFTQTLQAATGPAPLFGCALASASSYVRFSGGGTVDSWNSDPDNNPATAMVPYSFVAGQSTNYTAVIAATDTNGDYDGTNAIDLNQAQLYGYLATAGKSVTYSNSGSPPGRVTGPVASAANIDPARVSRSTFIPTSDTFTLSTPPLVPGGFTVLSFVTSILTIGAADNATYSAPTGFTMPAGVVGYTLNIDRPVQMVVNGDFTIGTGTLGDAKIVVRPPNGSLQVFVSGNVTIQGGGLVNQTNDPRKISFFCTSPATTPIVYNTAADFCGVIYAEHKPIDVQSNATFYGALLSDGYVRFSGGATSPAFHYDSSLRQVRFSNVTTPYIITSLTAL